jgi:pyruvate formate lyase activating enzyme
MVAGIDDHTACICYFGGDPTPQLPFALRAARLARQRNAARILRICWETNGTAHPALMDRMADLAIQSGGCIKFDLKAWDENLHTALTGVSNRRTLANFERVGHRIKDRPDPPLLVASTLLVPGYIDEQEVSSIARFIARIDPEIPYSLLAFFPHFHLADLPTTSRTHAQACFAAACQAGLSRVQLGNVHLLS